MEAIAMKLSIVIVNYNVEFFLEQCLQSVRKAIAGLEAEVFVVDNASVDHSMEMVAQKFPEVITICNTKNVGFSTANNQAIRQSKGAYVLLLNPDTVVEENTFKDTLAFMDAHPEAGGLGVKMIDGKGNYLPESKRGLPTPMVAFYKMFGFTALFPKSKRFARYYLGHLSEQETHEVEVLAGAFMLMRRTALDKSGLLDEDFFMYGEDIDLSYRLIKAGFKNYYFAGTSIIHYKGESTKKGSLNYVRVFYQAMVIFAEKHFSQSYARFFAWFINLAIYLRAGISLLRRFVSRISLPLLDACLLFGGLYYVKEYWEHNHRFVQGGEYPDALVWYAFPVYILFWILGLLLSAGYQRPAKLYNIFKGIGVGTLLILVGYSLVPEYYRYSRAIILLGAVWAILAIPLFHLLLQKVFGKNLLHQAQATKRLGIIGNVTEAARVEALVKQAANKITFIGYIAPNGGHPANPRYIGTQENLAEIVRVFNLDELIFCAKDVVSEHIFSSMRAVNPLKVEIKIAPGESDFVIGSNSIDHQGSWYSIQFNAISKPANKRAKRTLDILLSLGLLLLSPLLFWFSKHKKQYFSWSADTLVGKKTWLGYDTRANVEHLPRLRPGIFKTTQELGNKELDSNVVKHLNQLYAKEYKSETDLRFVLQQLF
jgi:GT2 family glycosyltransferase